MTKVIYVHPSTVSGVDTWEFRIATSCYDGCVRMFDDQGAMLIPVEHRASQLQCVALRNSLIASDLDTVTGLKEGVAIDENMQVIGQPDFPTTARILAVSRSGRYGVATDQMCYDRIGNKSWRCVPVEAGHDKWPMGVVEATNGEVFTVDESGTLRGWLSGAPIMAVKLPSAGKALDLSADQGLFVIADDARGVHLYNRSGALLISRAESYLVPCVKFLPDRRVVYGTHDGRLCVWDGQPEAVVTTPPPAPVAKAKGKGKG